MSSNTDRPQQDPITDALASAIIARLLPRIEALFAEHAEGAAPKRELLSVKELGDAIGASKSKIYKLIADGMPYVEVGATKRFLIADCIAFMKTQGAR